MVRSDGAVTHHNKMARSGHTVGLFACDLSKLGVWWPITMIRCARAHIKGHRMACVVMYDWDIIWDRRAGMCDGSHIGHRKRKYKATTLTNPLIIAREQCRHVYNAGSHCDSWIMAVFFSCRVYSWLVRFG